MEAKLIKRQDIPQKRTKNKTIISNG